MLLTRTWAGIAGHWQSRRFEWAMGGSAFAMGFALTLQPDMFHKAPHYAILAALAHESFYAALFFACGLFRVVALGLNGTFSRFRYSALLRAVASFLGALLWGSIAYSFVLMAARADTAYGPVVAYGSLAMLELANMRTSSTALGAWARSRG